MLHLRPAAALSSHATARAHGATGFSRFPPAYPAARRARWPADLLDTAKSPPSWDPHPASGATAPHIASAWDRHRPAPTRAARPYLPTPPEPAPCDAGFDRCIDDSSPCAASAPSGHRSGSGRGGGAAPERLPGPAPRRLRDRAENAKRGCTPCLDAGARPRRNPVWPLRSALGPISRSPPFFHLLYAA